MEQNKSELLDELYALRAGLSLISEENDKMLKEGVEADLKLGESLHSQEQLIEQGQCDYYGFCNWYNLYVLGGEREEFGTEKISYERRKEQGLLSTWDKNGYTKDDYEKYYRLSGTIGAKYYQNKLNNWLHDKEESVKQQEEALKVRKKQKLFFLCVTIACIIACIICMVCQSLFGIFPAVAAVVFLFSTLLIKTNGSERIKNEREDYQKLLAAVTSLNQIVEEYPAWETKAKEIVFKMETKISPMIDECEQLLGVLRKTYSAIIDERDWQYLDLIIFYLETGRADTMKEALVLVEREVQTQRIIDQIEEATQRICAAIAAAASRISRQLGVISAQLSVVTSLQMMQVSQNSRMIRDIELNNALIAKANVNSQKLMKDVAQIKSYNKK